jgi:hypothetical protein
VTLDSIGAQARTLQGEMSGENRSRSAGAGGPTAEPGAAVPGVAVPRLVRAAIAAAVVLPVLVAMALLAGSPRAHATVRARAVAAGVTRADRSVPAPGTAPVAPSPPLPRNGSRPDATGWPLRVGGARPGHDHGVRIAAILRQVRDNLGLPRHAMPAAVLAIAAATILISLGTRGRAHLPRGRLLARLPAARAPPALPA